MRKAKEVQTWYKHLKLKKKKQLSINAGVVKESFMEKAGGKGPETWEGPFQAKRNDLSTNTEGVRASNACLCCMVRRMA